MSIQAPFEVSTLEASGVCLTLTCFESLRSIVPQQRTLGIEEAQAFFASFETLSEKNHRNITFSLNTYKEGGKRSRQDVEAMTGVVFDFDNKHDAPTPLSAILRRVEDYTYFWYTTWSHTPTCPRWRLILPFSEHVESTRWEEIFLRACHLLDDDPGIDSNSKNPAMVYFKPYQKAGNPVRFGSHEGALLEPHTLPPLRCLGTIDRTLSFPSLSVFSPTPIEEAEKALWAIDPDLPYHEWLQVGMALKEGYGAAGFALWDAWSKRGRKYTAQSDNSPVVKWHSFKGGGVTLKTLFHVAKRHGFHASPAVTLPTSLPAVVPSEEDTELEEEEDAWGEFAAYDIFDLEPFPRLHTVYNLFKERARPFRPLLSLGATISLVGFILRDFMRCRDTRTNFYTMLLARTGAGKQEVLSLTQDILKSCDLQRYLTRDAGTIQGFEKKMESTSGVIFSVVDECPQFFGSLEHKNVSEHKSQLKKALKELFSCDGYASPLFKNSDAKLFENPFVSQMFLGTPDMFSKVTPYDFQGGLMGRLLIFHEDVSDVGMPSSALLEVPARKIQLPLNILPSASQNYLQFSQSCLDFYDAFQARLTKKRNEALTVEKDYVASRLGEYLIKLAMLTVEKGNVVTLPGMQWAASVAIHCFEETCRLMDTYFGQTPFSKERRKILALIQKLHRKNLATPGKKITLREISRASSYPVKFIEDILHNLEVCGEIVTEATPNPNRTKTIHVTYIGSRCVRRKGHAP